MASAATTVARGVGLREAPGFAAKFASSPLLVDFDLEAALHEFVGGAQTGDAGTQNYDLRHFPLPALAVAARISDGLLITCKA